MCFGDFTRCIPHANPEVLFKFILLVHEEIKGEKKDI